MGVVSGRMGGGLGLGARAGGGGAPALPAGAMFGALGDSITAVQTIDYGTWSAHHGVIRTRGFRTWAFWACDLSARRAWCCPDAVEGYSGHTIAQIAAALLPNTATRTIGAPGSTATIPSGVRAVRPDYCFVMAGTNDITQGVAPATGVSGLQTIWAALRAEGVEPIALSLLPRNDAFAAQSPVWNTAIEAAAAAAGVHYIDIYSGCDNGSGGFPPGWTYHNGVADPLGIHPGSEACHQIAADIAADLSTWLNDRARLPYVASGTTAVTERGALPDTTQTLAGAMSGGLFPSTTGWAVRYENTTTTVALDTGAPAEIGGVLEMEMLTPGVNAYSDRTAEASALTVVPGTRYALVLRTQIDCGHKDDSVTIGLYNTGFPGRMLVIIPSGAGQQNASTAAGASLTARDIYEEFVVPGGCTELRPWVEIRGANGSPGVSIRLAQFGVVGPL